MAESSGPNFDHDLETVFTAATEYIRQNNAKFETDKLLYFYARFKQAKEGPCNTPKPGFFDFQGKAKWEAWRGLGNLSQKQAKMDYVSLLGNLYQDWNSQLLSQQASQGSEGATQSLDEGSSQTPIQRQGLGVSVSRMAKTDGELEEGEKTVFDWCKEGNTTRVKDILESSVIGVNEQDEEGLGLLHWAADRGLVDMVKMLLSVGADINLKDNDKQTALHYAVSCDHSDLVRLLIGCGIDVAAKDCEGNTAMDGASDDVKMLFKTLSQT